MAKPDKPKITLKKLTLENFKNFQHVELELGPLTVLIGANATGKSNIREAFRFLHGLGRGYNLSEIIGEKWIEGGEKIWSGIRGGTHEIILKNGGLSRKHVFSLRLQFLWEFKEQKGIVDYFIQVVESYLGDVTLLKVMEETLEFNGLTLFELYYPKSSHGHFAEDEPTIEIVLPDGTLYVSYLEGPLTKPFLANVYDPQNDGHILSTPEGLGSLHAQEVAAAITSALRSMRFPDFRLDLMRQASFPGHTITTSAGENLSSVLYAICQDTNRKQMLTDWLRALTPMDVTDFKFPVDQVGRILVTLVEENGNEISAYSASDGTLRFLGTLAALLSPEPAHFYFFEELENGIHPTRLHLLVDLLESRTRYGDFQVVASTHSPLLLNYLSRESLEYASLLYRVEGQDSAQIKRIMDIPDARRLIEEQGIMTLHESNWFENVMYFLSDDENTPEVEAVP